MRIDQLLERSARFHRDAVAVEDAYRTVTFGELAAEVEALAARLAQVGVVPGDRVAVLAKNRIEYVALYFAASRLGAVAVPLNWRLGARELEFILRDAEARVVLLEQQFLPVLEAIVGELPALRTHVVLDDESGLGLLDGSSTAALLAEPDADAEAVVIQMYTSGTTGAPKGALLTHRNLVTLMTSWLLDMPLSPRRDTFLQVTPLFHVGAVLMVLSNVAIGSRLLLLSEFSPGPAADALAHRGVTKALFVPAMLRWLLAEPGITDQHFPDLRMIVYGAAPIPPSLLAEALGVFGCDFLQGYGLTETAGVLTTLRPEDHPLDGSDPDRLSSAGRAILCSDVRVVDLEDRPVPLGEVGELVARGGNITPGYWNLPEATRDTLRGGWFHTGDLARMDDQGFVTIVDRVKDMIIVGGENVYPREAEDALAAHPAVMDAAVIGVPHDTWGEAVLAMVVRCDAATVTDRELIQHCRQQLAKFKCPTTVEFCETIPRNAAGKILKAELREPHWAGRDRRV